MAGYPDTSAKCAVPARPLDRTSFQDLAQRMVSNLDRLRELRGRTIKVTERLVGPFGIAPQPKGDNASSSPGIVPTFHAACDEVAEELSQIEDALLALERATQ